MNDSEQWWKEQYTALREALEFVIKDRDELRAEVERLRQVLEQLEESV